MIISINSACATGRAGISNLYLLPCLALTDMTIENGQISSISLEPDTDWVQIAFEKNTAFFEQQLVRSGRNTYVSQTIQFVEPQMSLSNMRAAVALAKQCCMVAVVRDNNNVYHMAGVSLYGGTDYETRELQVQQISGQTGADVSSDSNEYTIIMQVQVNTLAPQLTASPLVISGVVALGPVAGGDTAFGPLAGGDTVFGF